MSAAWAWKTNGEKGRILYEWIRVFRSDPPGKWAHPCPACGSFVTEPVEHLVRMHGRIVEAV